MGKHDCLFLTNQYVYIVKYFNTMHDFQIKQAGKELQA